LVLDNTSFILPVAINCGRGGQFSCWSRLLRATLRELKPAPVRASFVVPGHHDRSDQPFGSLTLLVALTASLRFTAEQFEQLCQVNPEAVLERCLLC
jgi:hypothetical protein